MTSARVAQAFARHLPSYDIEARAQRLIARTLFQALQPVTPRHPRLLEAGHGTGFLTGDLMTLQPQALWLNDLSAPLPDLQYPVPPQVLAGDIAHLPLPPQLDLIASASMLQWLPEPEALIRRFCAALRPGGVIALSGFGPGNFPELAQMGLPAGAPSYRDAKALVAGLPEGMEILWARDATITLTFASAQGLFGHLRATGVNGAQGGQMAPSVLKSLMARMNLRGNLTLTYCPSYLLARRPGRVRAARGKEWA